MIDEKMKDNISATIGTFTCNNKNIYLYYIITNLLYIIVYIITFINFNKNISGFNATLNTLSFFIFTVSTVTNYILYSQNKEKKFFIFVIIINIFVALLFLTKFMVKDQSKLDKITNVMYAINIIVYNLAYLYHTFY